MLGLARIRPRSHERHPLLDVKIGRTFIPLSRLIANLYFTSSSRAREVIRVCADHALVVL